MKKKILLILTLFMIGIPVYAKGEKNNNYLDRNYQMAVLSTRIEKKIKEEFNIKRVFEDKYPPYFGGMYVSDDANNLIIQIVKDKIPDKKQKEYDFYKELINYDSRIKIEYVDNSFNDLNYVNNSVATYMDNNNIDKNLLGSYIDVMNNSIKVELDNMDISKQEIIASKILKKHGIKSSNIYTKNNKNPILHFEKGEKQELLEYVEAGAKFDTGNANCSMGFRAKYKGRFIYVSAGHCFSELNPPKHGVLLLKKFENNGYYDYAFVEMYANITVSNYLRYKHNDIRVLSADNVSPNIVVNLTVAKNGYATEYTSGKIKGLNKTVETDNGSIKGLVTTNVRAERGDSGGVVFIPRSESDGGAIAIGVVSTGKSILGILNEMSFTSINDMYPITRY